MHTSASYPHPHIHPHPPNPPITHRSKLARIVRRCFEGIAGSAAGGLVKEVLLAQYPRLALLVEDTARCVWVCMCGCVGVWVWVGGEIARAMTMYVYVWKGGCAFAHQTAAPNIPLHTHTHTPHPSPQPHTPSPHTPSLHHTPPSHSNIQRDTEIKGSAPPALDATQTTQLLQTTASLQQAYLAACVQRLTDSAVAAFPGGARALPPAAELQKCIAYVIILL